MRIVVRRIPVFAAGALLGIAFAMIYWQGRNGMREAMKKPIEVRALAPLEISISFEAPWALKSNAAENKLLLLEEKAGQLIKLQEWSAQDIAKNKSLVTSAALVTDGKYRLQGLLEACASNTCVPYAADLALHAASDSSNAKSLAKITLPYIPSL